MKQAIFWQMGLVLLCLNCAHVATTKIKIPIDTASYAQIIDIIRDHNEQLHTLHGRGKLIVESLGRSYSVATQVIIKRPDTLFIRLETVFGMDVGWLFVDKDKFTFYLPMQNIYYTGVIDSLAVVDFLELDLDYNELFSAITHSHLFKDLSQPQVLYKNGKIFITGYLQSENHVYTIDPARGVVIEKQVRDKENRLILLEQYERFVGKRGVQIPSTIRIRRPLARQGLTLFYEEMKVNSKLSHRDFKRKIPVDALQGIL